MLPPASWQYPAACATQPAELWFTDNKAEQAEAQRICATCPALTPCHEYALAQAAQGLPLVGIWAGLTKNERDRLVA